MYCCILWNVLLVLLYDFILKLYTHFLFDTHPVSQYSDGNSWTSFNEAGWGVVTLGLCVDYVGHIFWRIVSIIFVCRWPWGPPSPSQRRARVLEGVAVWRAEMSVCIFSLGIALPLAVLPLAGSGKDFHWSSAWLAETPVKRACTA